MSSTEIEFVLSASQFALMDYPGLTQGRSITITLDGGVLLPDVAAESWFAVQKESVASRFVKIGPAMYAFAGQITEANLFSEDDEQTAVLLVMCGEIPLRVICAPQDDGRLPFGTWETRYISGLCRLQGIMEDDFATGIGQTVEATVWNTRRLILTPGDPKFGDWHETTELSTSPYRYDLVLITTRLHRKSI